MEGILFSILIITVCFIGKVATDQLESIEELLKEQPEKEIHFEKTSYNVAVCPVCNGRGKLQSRFYDTVYNQSLIFDKPEKDKDKIKCRSCNGKGFILIDNDEPQIVYKKGK